MSRKYYHGTSFPNMLSILHNGFNSEKTIWNCSDNRFIYLASATDEDESQEAFYQAVEAAQIAAAFVNQMETDVAVFEFDIPENIIETFVTDDDSCENMYGCYEIRSTDLNRLIETEQVSVSVHLLKGGYNPNFRVFLLPVNNEYLNEIEDRTFVRAAKLVADSDALTYIMEDVLGCYDEDDTRTLQETKCIYN